MASILGIPPEGDIDCVVHCDRRLIVVVDDEECEVQQVPVTLTAWAVRPFPTSCTGTYMFIVKRHIFLVCVLDAVEK